MPRNRVNKFILQHARKNLQVSKWQKPHSTKSRSGKIVSWLNDQPQNERIKMSIERTPEDIARFNSDMARIAKRLAPEKLKRNDVVKVYQKPITDEKLEGKARLYQHHAQEDAAELGERWTVVFSDGAFVDRWIHPRNLVRETGRAFDGERRCELGFATKLAPRQPGQLLSRRIPAEPCPHPRTVAKFLAAPKRWEIPNS